jgi:hypothetical protein
MVFAVCSTMALTVPALTTTMMGLPSEWWRG